MNHEDGVAQPGDDSSPAGLTIGDLAQRTGLSPAVLRMWESRHGFPEPQRLASGHRRYTDADVDLVQQVLRRKDSGTRLEAAIGEVSARQAPDSPSVFAELRRLHPALPVHRLKKSTLIALSRAIEDECCATADRPVLFAAFQTNDYYEPSAPRWNELARVARSTIVFADHWVGGADDTVGPVRATLAEDAPMRREWAVVCDAPGTAAALSAWELPGQTDIPDRARIFESVWTVDPVAVRDAARVAASVAADAGTPGAEHLRDHLADPPAGRGPADGGIALLNRVVAYVDRLT